MYFSLFKNGVMQWGLTFYTVKGLTKTKCESK